MDPDDPLSIAPATDRQSRAHKLLIELLSSVLFVFLSFQLVAESFFLGTNLHFLYDG